MLSLVSLGRGLEEPADQFLLLLHFGLEVFVVVEDQALVVQRLVLLQYIFVQLRDFHKILCDAILDAGHPVNNILCVSDGVGSKFCLQSICKSPFLYLNGCCVV